MTYIASCIGRLSVIYMQQMRIHWRSVDVLSVADVINSRLIMPNSTSIVCIVTQMNSR